MEEGMRSGEHSGIVVKNRSSSGCLIVRKKGDGSGGVGSVGARKVYESKKEKKRHRMILSDSGSSDELLMPPRRRVGPEAMQMCNGLAFYGKGILEESEIGRKRIREGRIRGNEDGFIRRNGADLSDSKRNRLDVFDFNEYDGVDETMMMMRGKQFDYSGEEVGDGRFLGSMPLARSSIERDYEYESGSSRHVFLEKKKNLYFERSSSLGRGDHDDRNRFGKGRDGSRLPLSSFRERFMSDSDESIRVQGKNGVLKVMVNKKKKVGGPLKNFDHLEMEEDPSGARIEGTVRRNLPNRPSFYSETEVIQKPGSLVRTEKKKMNLLRSSSANKSKGSDSESEDSDTSLKHQTKNVEASNSKKRIRSNDEKVPGEQLPPARTKEGKVRRGCGTEKQKLRERIRGMLLDAGWTIDYRPRRNRDYLDAVYINPTGTAYWSIIKAYDALLKQLNDEEDERKNDGDGSAFTPLSDEVLSQLTRKTRKKIEKEIKKRQADDSDADHSKEATARRSSSTRHEDDSMDSQSHEEKLSSFIKHSKLKHRTSENSAFSVSSKSQSSILHLHDSAERPSSISNVHVVQGRKSRKLGRCTLLVRRSAEGLSKESDGFVPYKGKRTVLSWLIDSGTVQLSEKVQYMNRRRTKVMLEGWITRDGIHCGCCSKILTVSKFEIHAGSKLRQPFQNIYLDSGLSLLQCQMDAWNRQEESEKMNFHSVDTDGDDPNDDTCGICGDGGDLICCDGCPSTFHQSCLSIELLPPGDWHCPNCTCKFCGIGGDIAEEDCLLLTCTLCEKKYHNSCIEEANALPVDSSSSVHSFCGQKCRELFEQLQKYLGVKNELEAGFSWSLIRRTDADSDTSLRGFPQRVECNSKLAVALTVMDECFLPIVDRRSGINLIHNVLYNCGSNFNRLNYSGFYTAILERGDEIISAASIRFHGTQLAEMPFIGTRHIYRRQGMCRRLFCAIETALCSLKVEKLVIPAIAELMHTWTAVFGFSSLEESLKQELRSMNMLVFPGIDMLRKLLLKPENTIGDIPSSTGAMKTKHSIMHEATNKSEMDSSSGREPDECDDGNLHHGSRTNGEVATADSDSQCPNVSTNDASGSSGSLDASLEANHSVSAEGAACVNSQAEDNRNESISDKKSHSIPDSNGGILEMEKEALREFSPEDKLELDTPANGNTVDTAHAADDDVASSDEIHRTDKPQLDSPANGHTKDTTDADDVDVASDETNHSVAVEETTITDSQSGDKLAKFVSSEKCLLVSATSCDTPEMEEKKFELSSPEEDNAQSCKKSAIGVTHVVEDNVVASQEPEIPMSIGGTMVADPESGEKLPASTSDGKSRFISGTSDAVEMESKPALHPPVEEFNHPCEVNNVSGNVTCPESDLSLRETVMANIVGDYDANGGNVACPESVPSPRETVVEKKIGDNREIPDVSVSSSNGSSC